MALIKCKECGHMISDRARKCPKCGCPKDVEASHDGLANNNRDWEVNEKSELRTNKPQQKFAADKEKEKIFAIIIGILVALIVSAIIGYHYDKKIREQWAAEKMEQERVDSINRDEIERDELDYSNKQAQEMPSFLQVMKLWREIDKKIPSYDYSNVKANNFALLSNDINGMKLVHCEVKKTKEYSEPNGGSIDVTIPIICYGINSKVKNITYSSYDPNARFTATSEHACGILWSKWDYGQNFIIYIKDKEDAMIFSNEMEMHVGRGREDSLLVSSDDKSISVNGTCYMGNSYPLFKNGWYVFKLRLN